MTTYLRILILIEYITSFCCQAIALGRFMTMVRIIFYGRKKIISSILLYYLCSWMFSTIPCVIHYGYMLLFWKSEDILYNSYALFWTAVFAFSSVCLLPTALLSLTIERCWVLISGSLNRKGQKVFLLINGLVSIGCFSLIFYSYGKDPPTSPSTNCSTSGCIVSQSGHRIYVNFKMIVGGTNVLFGIIFFMLLTWKRKSVSKGLFLQSSEQKKRRVNNLLVIFLIIIDFWLSFLPYCLDTIFTFFSQVNSTVYIGPYSSMLLSIDACIGSYVYSRNIRKLLEKSKIPRASRAFTVTT